MSKRFSLVALASGLTLAKPKSENDLPQRILVAPWGETVTRKGKVIVNETTLAVLEAAQLANKFDRVALDFQHNTVKKGAEPVKVAAYGTPEVVKGEGIYLSALEYTPEGKEMLPGGHYPDISPAVVRNDQGEVIFLHSVGACRQGEIDGLTLFSASDSSDISTFEPMEDIELEVEGEDDAEEDPAAGDLREIVRALIMAIAPDVEIPEGAGDTELAAAAKQAVTALGATALSAGGAKKTEEPTKTTEADQEPVAMAAEAVGRITALEAKWEKRERAALVKQATADGKVIPLSAEQIDILDLTVLESMIENLPVTVPMQSRIAGAVDDFQATPGNAAITPELREVTRQLGLKPEEVAAFSAR